MKKQNFLNQITINPKVRFGRPIIRGTRVPVELIVGKVAGGMAIEEIMKEYGLTRPQVLVALKYAAAIVAGEELSFA